MGTDTDTHNCCDVLEHVFLKYTIHVDIRFYVLVFNS